MSADTPGEASGEAPLTDIDRVMMALYPTAEITVTDEGHVAVAAFHPQPEHRGNPGWLQGGLAATVLDHVSARAAAAALAARVVTGTLDLRYPHPVPLDGGPYRVQAVASGARGRMVRVSAELTDADGRALVEARGLFLVRPGPA